MLSAELNVSVVRLSLRCDTVDQHMTHPTTTDEISMNKTVIATEDTVTFTYRIDSPQESVTRIELIEQLPESVTPSAIDFGDHDDGMWEYRSSYEVAFLIEQPRTGPIETTVQVVSPTLDPNECVSEIRTSHDWPAPKSIK